MKDPSGGQPDGSTPCRHRVNGDAPTGRWMASRPSHDVCRACDGGRSTSSAGIAAADSVGIDGGEKSHQSPRRRRTQHRVQGDDGRALGAGYGKLTREVRVSCKRCIDLSGFSGGKRSAGMPRQQQFRSRWRGRMILIQVRILPIHPRPVRKTVIMGRSGSRKVRW